jgi:hypothetical protein
MSRLIEEFADDDKIKALSIVIENILRELLTSATKVEKEFPHVQVTGYWIGNQLRINIK